MKNGRWAILLVLALLSLFFLSKLGHVNRTSAPTEQGSNQDRQRKEKAGSGHKESQREKSSPETAGERDGLNRNISRIIYTRHAKCRMDCRMIDVSEVEEILLKGSINYQKSDLRSMPDPKYALEGNTHDGQQVRIVFANSPRGPVVVTVIDLEKEWSCDCK